MKKYLLVAVLFLMVFTLTACDEICVGPECIVTAEDVNTPDDNIDPEECEDPICEECPEPEVIEGTVVQNAIQFDHISGHGDVTEKDAFILLEFPFRDYVRYQLTYLSCTCRNPDLNYWQVAFVEITKGTSTTPAEISLISFADDSTGHYVGGMWGDSSPTPEGKTLEDFETEFIPWLVGQSLVTLDGILVFSNEEYHGLSNTTTIDDQDLIDGYVGSSVSTNNMIRSMKSLLEYHEEKYN